MQYDLGEFRASDMVSCGAALRGLCAGARSHEEAAQRLVQALYDGFVDRQRGERACVLVRLYETRPLRRLDDARRAFARGLLGAGAAPLDMPCLVLIASTGAEPAWCFPEGSMGHRAIPLASQAIRRLPMIAQLLAQMGVPISTLARDTSPRLAFEASSRTYNVFYVPEARGSPHIPAQEDFVIPYGVRSVLGFGGLFENGELFAVILFSRVRISSETASLFRTVALSVKAALVAIGSDHRGDSPGEAARDQLLDALEAISYERFQSLERTLDELDRNARELRGSQEALRLANAEIERRADDAVRASEARLRRLWESNIIGVMYADAHGNVTDANDAFLRMVGYTRHDLVAGRVRWSDLTAPEYRPLDERGIAESLERGACTPYEKVYIGRDGRRVPILIGYALLAGSIDQYISFALDLTEQKRAEERERAARAEAERASRLKDEFVATVSHELRSPLNAIQGWTQLLGRPGASPEHIAKGLEVIERNTRQLAQLVSDLLDTSRIVSGKLRVEMELVDVAGAVEAALEGLRPSADQKGVVLRVSRAPLGCHVHADSVRLRQVVENLLSNAIKFTPRGGRVDVTLEERPDQIVLSVRDTGQGIESAFLPYVFDRFRQADASTARQHGGLGLGLAIVKHVIELHAGSVHVSSDGPGKGTELVVTLPRAAAEASLCARSEAAPLPAHGVKGMTVLVVDDDPDAREIAQRILEEHGAVVVTAASAGEALDALAARLPDVVVSDIGMPGISGYELVRQLRGVPAVALTAFVRPEDKERALAAGFRAHVAKPVEPAELVFAVASTTRPAR